MNQFTWIFLIIGSAVLELMQETTWTLKSFQFGLTIFSSSNPFSIKVPEEFTNKTFETKDAKVKFITQDVGIYRASLVPLFGFFSRSTHGFPMLGEIRLSNEDIAQIKIRVLFSFASLTFATLIGLVIFFASQETASVVPSFLEASATMILIGLLSLSKFLPEKDKMIRRFNDIKNYLEDTVETPMGSKNKKGK